MICFKTSVYHDNNQKPSFKTDHENQIALKCDRPTERYQLDIQKKSKFIIYHVSCKSLGIVTFSMKRSDFQRK